MALFARALYGGVGEGFTDEWEAWKATDVVLVATSEHDGLFEVLETWKGSLNPGELIRLPELIPAADAQPLSEYRREGYLEDFQPIGRQQIPRQPVGARMVLFLKHSSDPPGASQWQAANAAGIMKSSVVWIENGRLFSFGQKSNPGTLFLHEWNESFSESDLEDRVKHVVEQQLQMEQVMEREQGSQRALSLKPFVKSDVFIVRRSALDALSKSGPLAAPVIESMLTDSSYQIEEPLLIWALNMAGGEAEAPFLGALYQREVAFWESTAPTLSPGWWIASRRTDSPLFERQEVIEELMEALGSMHYAGALQPAMRLRQLWISLPQLIDSGSMANECERLIAAIQQN